MVSTDPNANTGGNDWVGQELDLRYILEIWRMYQSGQFVSVSGMWRDWERRSSENPGGAGPTDYLPLWDTILRFTEIYEFAARLALTEAGAAAMRVDVKIGNLHGRSLKQDDSNRTPVPSQRFKAQDFSYPLSDSPPIPREKLVSEAHDLAAEGLSELFKRFGFVVNAQGIRSWQDELDR